MNLPNVCHKCPNSGHKYLNGSNLFFFWFFSFHWEPTEYCQAKLYIKWFGPGDRVFDTETELFPGLPGTGRFRPQSPDILHFAERYQESIIWWMREKWASNIQNINLFQDKCLTDTWSHSQLQMWALYCLSIFILHFCRIGSRKQGKAFCDVFPSSRCFSI